LARLISTGQCLLWPNKKLTGQRNLRVFPVVCRTNKKPFKRLWEDYALAHGRLRNPPTKMLNPFGMSENPKQLRQRGADIGEDRVNSCGYVVNARDANECNQGNQQRIFDQILTLFAVLQALEFHVKFQK
jgi:hypothetical protein